MALTFQPFGFSLYEYLGGKPSHSLIQVPLSLNPNASPGPAGISASFGQGDLVIWDSTTGYSGLANYPATPAANTTTTTNAYTVAGIIDGFNYTAQNGTSILSEYWGANTATFQNQGPNIKLNPLPNCIFMAQCNAPLPAAGAYGYNFYVSGNGFAIGSGSAATSTVASSSTGQSTQFINVTTAVGGGAGNKGGLNSVNGTIKIIGLAPINAANQLLSTNNWNDPYPIVLCRINQHQFNAPTPSAG